MSTLLAGLRAAAEPTRLRLLALCAEGELTVSELIQILGQSQPRVSRHLKVLTDAGLLDRVPEGNWVFYRLRADGAGAAVASALVHLISEDDPDAGLDRRRLAAVRTERQARADQYFRQNAKAWNALRLLSVDDASVDQAIGSLLADQPVDDLLDIGTGTGRMLELFGPAARDAIGVDLSSDMLHVARANLNRAGLSRCGVRKADMYQLPFPDHRFDTVTIHQVLHYADDPARVIAEAQRVLRPGGRLLIADFAPHGIEGLRADHQHRRLGFADDDIATWLRVVGLTLAEVRRLPGERLTVVLWLAINGAAASVPAPSATDVQLETHP